MNTLHIVSASSWRGGERQVLFLLEGLKKKGHTCFLMTPKNSVLHQRSSNHVDIVLHYRKGIIGLIRNIFKLTSFCNKNNVEVIHGHDSHAHTLVWLAYKTGGLRNKSVVTRRLLNPVKSRSKSKYNYPKIERIICISKAVYHAISPSIIDNNRLKVIHSGIQLNSALTKPKVDLPSGEISVGYVAAFTSEKDHKTFLKTAEYLSKTYPNLSLKYVLIGDGPLKAEIERLSQQINAKFIFTGFVNNVDDFYAKLDIIFHPSTSEALGTSILDAMKYGLPVVSTIIGGIPELIKEGQNGLLFNPRDYKGMGEAIVQLVNDKTLYQEISKANKTRVINFDIDTIVQKTIEIYNSIL